MENSTAISQSRQLTKVRFALAFLFFIGASLKGNCDPVAKAALFTQGTSVLNLEGVSKGEILQELVRIGELNQMPLGIVVSDQRLCSTSLYGLEGRITVDKFMELLRRSVPGYNVDLREGSLIVYPNDMPTDTLQLLRLTIPSFVANRDTHAGIARSLFFFVRAVLVPNEGTAFAGPVQLDDELIQGFTLKNKSVEEILDYIITKGAGGFWIMDRVPLDWKSNPTTMPYFVRPYSSAGMPLSELTCPADPKTSTHRH